MSGVLGRETEPTATSDVELQRRKLMHMLSSLSKEERQGCKHGTLDSKSHAERSKRESTARSQAELAGHHSTLSLSVFEASSAPKLETERFYEGMNMEAFEERMVDLKNQYFPEPDWAKIEEIKKTNQDKIDIEARFKDRRRSSSNQKMEGARGERGAARMHAGAQMGRSGPQPERKPAWPRRGAATELNTTRVIGEPGEDYKELGHSSTLAVQEAYYGHTQGLASDVPQKALQATMSNVQNRKMSLRST